jgi:hypothetical protein
MKIKSAMGKVVDITSLMRENEEVLAVSNVKMNARGDRLGSDGKVIVPVQQIAKKQKSEVSPIISTSIENAAMPAKVMAEEEKKIATKKTKKAESKVVNIVSKTDEAGNTFSEIEYEDGSIEIKQDGAF